VIASRARLPHERSDDDTYNSLLLENFVSIDEPGDPFLREEPVLDGPEESEFSEQEGVAGVAEPPSEPTFASSAPDSVCLIDQIFPPISGEEPTALELRYPNLVPGFIPSRHGRAMRSDGWVIARFRCWNPNCRVAFGEYGTVSLHKNGEIFARCHGEHLGPGDKPHRFTTEARA
jgi:hypothetical protein